MEVYDYYTLTHEHKYGFRIWTTDDKTELPYTGAGFNTYSEAETRMKEVLADLEDRTPPTLDPTLKVDPYPYYKRAIHKGE